MAQWTVSLRLARRPTGLRAALTDRRREHALRELHKGCRETIGPGSERWRGTRRSRARRSRTRRSEAWFCESHSSDAHRFGVGVREGGPLRSWRVHGPVECVAGGGVLGPSVFVEDMQEKPVSGTGVMVEELGHDPAFSNPREVAGVL